MYKKLGNCAIVTVIYLNGPLSLSCNFLFQLECVDGTNTFIRKSILVTHQFVIVCDS